MIFRSCWWIREATTNSTVDVVVYCTPNERQIESKPNVLLCFFFSFFFLSSLFFSRHRGYTETRRQPHLLKPIHNIIIGPQPHEKVLWMTLLLIQKNEWTSTFSLGMWRGYIREFQKLLFFLLRGNKTWKKQQQLASPLKKLYPPRLLLCLMPHKSEQKDVCSIT